MSGRHVERVRPARLIRAEVCAQNDYELDLSVPCPLCDHGGGGRHRAWPPAQPAPLAARSSSQAGLATLRDVWSNDPDRTTRRGVLA